MEYSRSGCSPQLSPEKDFLSNVDYLKSLVKELKSKPSSAYDSNLVYEAVYADMYVTDLLTKTNSPQLVANINDIRLALDIIISDIPDSKVLSARQSQDYTSILKNKYTNIDDGGFEEEVAYNYVEENSVIKHYLKQRFPTLVLLFALVFIIVSGLPYKLVGMIGEILSTSNEATNTTQVVTSPEFTASFEAMQGILRVLISLITIMLLMVTTLTTVIDLIYLTMPMIRHFLDREVDGARMISIQAKASIEAVDNNLVKYKKIKSFDRIKRNLYWLDSMIDSLANLRLQGHVVDESFVSSLLSLKVDIEGTQEKSKRYYMLVAKIEFMHDKYLQIIDGVAV